MRASTATAQPVLGSLVQSGSFGGTGGSAFGPIDCPTGSMAVGIRGRAGDDIDRTQLACRLNTSFNLGSPVFGGAVFTVSVGGGGSDWDETLTCPAGSVLTGIRAAQRGSG